MAGVPRTRKTKSGTKSSDLPLSEAARHVVVPDGIVSTAWPSCRDTLKNLGITFDRWQQGLAKVVLAKRKDGAFAATIGGVVISIPRQVGKTFFVGSLVFAQCLQRPGIKVIWTAHHTKTSDETFDAMREMCRMKNIRPHVKRILSGGGTQRIIFENGSEIEFGARESGFGRGKTKVAMLVLDECQHVSESALENLVPTMNQGDNPLLFMMGTPPRPNDRGEAFKNRRSQALSGSSKDMVFVEFSADSDARIEDRKQWSKANPSFPARTPADSIMRLLASLGEPSFRREALGIWDEDNLGAAVIEPAWWDSTLLGADVPLPDGGVTSFGVRFSADGSWVSLAGAMKFGKDDPIFVELIESRSMAYGIDWLAAFLAERWRDVSMIVIDGKSDATALHQALVRAGVHQSAINFGKGMIQAPQAADAYSTFVNAARAGEIWHSDDEGQEELDKSAATSKRRKIGVAGAFGFESMRVGVDNCVPLEAAALARYAASVSKRRPAGAKRVGGAIAM